MTTPPTRPGLTQMKREERACRAREQMWADKTKIAAAIGCKRNPHSVRLSGSRVSAAIAEMLENGDIELGPDGEWVLTADGREVYADEAVAAATVAALGNEEKAQ